MRMIVSRLITLVYAFAVVSTLCLSQSTDPKQATDGKSSPAFPSELPDNGVYKTCFNPPVHPSAHKAFDSSGHELTRYATDKNIQRSWYSPRWRSQKALTIGEFDMTDVSCVPKAYEIYVDNGDAITFNIKSLASQTCFANITYADNPSRDYGAIFLSLIAPNLGKIQPPLRTPGVSSQKLTLPSDGIKNTTAAVVIACRVIPKKDKPDSASTNDIASTTEESKEILAAQRKVTVHYGDLDLFSASTGAIVSTLGKRIYGIQNSQLINGTTSKIALTSSSTIQFVPIALVNLNYAGNKNFNWNIQAGLGVNPNGSSTQVEYFVSPFAFSAHNLYLSPGLHIARSERIVNGFYVGDAVSSPTFAVPTQWVATYKLGFTVSYKPYK